MNAVELRRAIEDVTVLDEFEDRKYLGMSQIGECPRRLCREMIEGRRSPDLTGRRLCHEGYVHERDVLERLARAGLVVVNQGRELVADFDERFRGHIDGELEGDLIEIKSVTPEAFVLVARGELPARHVAQVQAYMRYGDYQGALVVYIRRADGAVWVASVERDWAAGKRLEEKARQVLAAVDEGQAWMAPCECGRCR